MLKTIKISNFLKEEEICFDFSKPFINLYKETTDIPNYFVWKSLGEFQEPSLSRVLKLIKMVRSVNINQEVEVNPINDKKSIDIYIELKNGATENIMLVDKKLFSRSVVTPDGSYLYADVSYTDTKDIKGELHTALIELYKNLNDILFLDNFEEGLISCNDPKIIKDAVEKMLPKLFSNIKSVNLDYKTVRIVSKTDSDIVLSFNQEGSGFNQAVNILVSMFCVIYEEKIVLFPYLSNHLHPLLERALIDMFFSVPEIKGCFITNSIQDEYVKSVGKDRTN